jgi:hypothetical protein
MIFRETLNTPNTDYKTPSIPVNCALHGREFLNLRLLGVLLLMSSSRDFNN